MASSLELADTLEVDDDDRIAQAEALVRSYCRWHIAPSRDDTYNTHDTGTSVILLPSLYVTDVTSLTYDGVEVDPTTYWWNSAGVVTFRRSGWGTYCTGWGYGAIVVEFTHGYPEAPADVTAVVQALAARAIDNPKSLKAWTRGPFAEVYADSTTSVGELSSLNYYKIPPRF